nr:hypothetical protein [uncultured Pseudomonas sp.]
MDDAIQAQFSRSFSAKLYMRSTAGNIPLRLSRSSDKFSWGITPEDDWLQAGGRVDSPLMNFHFLSSTHDRLHYDITLPGGPHVKRLGVSRNGYLGFYWNAEVTDPWKIEPLRQTEEGLVCYLRDHRGHRVGAVKDTPHLSRDVIALLNVDEGTVYNFLLKQR